MIVAHAATEGQDAPLQFVVEFLTLRDFLDQPGTGFFEVAPQALKLATGCWLISIARAHWCGP